VDCLSPRFLSKLQRLTQMSHITTSFRTRQVNGLACQDILSTAMTTS